MPKWACAIVDATRPMVGDPKNSRCTHAQTFGTRLLSHAILDDPQYFSQVIGNLEWDRAMDEEYYYLMKNHT